ncbi:MAG TPA: SPFH domain-containing protein [Gemmatimonadales bacterium]|jgi:regulator of protease activity HflC (stomatin/prohibitin superfamily)|nr:SPFH domain-containing protein [Gemmatimonadales bacterium]
MGTIVLGVVILLVAVVVRSAGAGLRNAGGKASGALVQLVSLGLLVIGLLILVSSTIKVIDAGQVGVQHAFGKVSPQPLLSGVRFVPPWSSVERYSTREEQWPAQREGVETMDALSNEQMSMKVDAAVRWQIDPMQAPKIFTEIGTEEQIKNVVVNAIRKGVRDGMVQFSINDISKRNAIANAMEFQVDSALLTRPRAGGEPFRIAKITAFYLRNLEPPAQVVAAINNKIAADQQIETEKHKVEVARLQSDQQRFLNQTLTAEALMKQYLEVLHDMRASNNLVVLVPTEGGVPLLDLAALRRNLPRGQ